jgi:hypothetical protein
MISGAESGGVPGVHQVGGQVDRGSNRTFMISGAESGGVPSVHQVGGQGGSEVQPHIYDTRS